MQFWISKCAMLVMWRGKVTKTDGIRMTVDREIKNLKKGKSYKYLGVLESDQMWCREMKSNVTKEYFCRIRKVLKSKVNGGNVIRAVNTWIVSLMRYIAAFIDWFRKELRYLDRKTRKYLTLYNAFHPRDSVTRLYLPRNGGGLDLIAVEGGVELSKASLAKWVSESNERMLSAARGNMKWDGDESNEIKRRKVRERTEEVRCKKLHGQFLMEMDESASENSWSWLRTGYLKKETEGLLVAAHIQALRTNAIKGKIDKSQEKSLRRLCHQKNETVNHIDTVAKALHWDLSRQYEFNSGGKWFEHAPENAPDSVLENDKDKILCDFTIQTD